MSADEPDLRAVCEAFNGAGASYALIGGFAVIVAGYVRATRDVDLLIPDDAPNTERVLDALRALGAEDQRGRQPDPVNIGERGGGRYITRAGELDLLVEGEPPLDFEGVRAEAELVDLEGTEIPVCGLAHLVAFKRLAGRPRDRADLAELEALHGFLPKLDFLS